ncbi:hypothetical protein [Streptomyces sp. DG1A-41]|uniref:hypothetical protein n=1 Tax=Streptomyces sp. DG1A-41 TaxID=3125779 RepID=UPI0030CBC310
MRVVAERASSQSSVDVFERTGPGGGGYRTTHMSGLGGKVTLPDPVGIELDAEELEQYVD